ncbi:ribosomal protein S5 domain 2-like protein [Lentinus tigrinus ALCF2SS1-7]|uniref:Ribosomal protein S5 domain 2-like protein n=1 Tax=Lentinus tigrinus ALCF2SS1-6 TaxID=1328759 RepID=A0A5C2S474_9APHY|nr:ribosomal protein S5 domain 2-like protein [Lentinus tigrinus ALCF2SS1-6]RPD71925.1 ribosomal protein S5 domain 2-like protein [Lentinus tigrinus ALCF2SS1-7]
MSSNLDSFVKTAKPPPKPLATSQEIRDRASTFVASVFPATSLEEVRKAVNHLKHVTHGARPASHEIAAWRCMVLKPGKDGLGGPDDFEVISGSDDDGEKYAGGRVLKVMQAEGVIDAVVVVSRWFGGEMLGRVRFDHIEMCAREVCHVFRRKDDMATCIATLTSLDETLASLRTQLAAATAEGSTSAERGDPQADGTSAASVPKKPPAPSYTALEESLDVAKAKRLITARENSIKSVRAALKKVQEKA